MNNLISCNICKKEIIPKTLYRKKNKEFSDIVRCPACHVSFIHPQPDSKTISDYYNGMYAEIAEYDKLKMKYADRSLKAYRKVINNINSEAVEFLDLGCGLGYYSKAAEELGYKVTAVEQDNVSYNFAKNILELNHIIEMSIDDFIDSSDKKYDIVFLRHVIEHVTQPLDLIQRLEKIISETGILVIETDNNNGIELLFRPHSLLFYMNLYKQNYHRVNFINLLIKRPFAIDYPRHLFAFNMKNLSLLLKQNGFKVKKKIHYQTGHSIYWPNLKPPGGKDLLKYIMNFKIKSAVNVLVEYTVYPLRIILKFFGLSAGLCIYAQKGDLD